MHICFVSAMFSPDHVAISSLFELHPHHLQHLSSIMCHLLEGPIFKSVISIVGFLFVNKYCHLSELGVSLDIGM